MVEGNLPVFAGQLKTELTFPWSWRNSRGGDFRAWKRRARAKVGPYAPIIDKIVYASSSRTVQVSRAHTLSNQPQTLPKYGACRLRAATARGRLPPGDRREVLDRVAGGEHAALLAGLVAALVTQRG